MAQERQIKYTNRNFSDFRDQLVEYTRNYFPDTYNDFSPTSPGMMFLEMASYVGDVLSFYQDTQLQETFLQYAKNPGNLYNLSYMMGYRPKVTTVANVELEISHTVPALSSGGSFSPDYTKAMVIGENSIISSNTNTQVKFITDRKVDFSFSSSLDPTTVTVDSYSGTDPATYRLTKKVTAFSGEVKTITNTFSSYEKFATVTIDDTDIIGVLDVNDGSNTWYEVPFLGQETIYSETRNTNSDNDTVYNTLVLQNNPRRFVTRFNSTGQLIMQFGSGTIGSDDSTFIPTLENVGLGTAQGISRLDYAYDPTNFLYSRTYGLAPLGTLTIQYLKGGGVDANVPANSISTQTSIVVDSDPGSRQSTLTVTNPLAASGGSTGDTVEELRLNAQRAFAEQSRTVTLQDYEVRALSLPSTLGNLSKVYAVQDQLTSTRSTTDSIIDSNPLSISLYTLAYDIEGKLATATATLKENLKNYLSQYILVTDAVNIKDAFIVNVGVDFEIVVSPNALGREVLLNCTRELTSFFSTDRWRINQPIILSSISSILNSVKGVSSVKNIKVINKNGGQYSQYGYDIEGATKDGVVYPSLDPCIFEVKYPRADIRGRIVSY